MSRYWRKGCLCGCLYPEECRYYEPPPQEVVHRVEVVHVHVYEERPALEDPSIIDVEVIEE